MPFNYPEHAELSEEERKQHYKDYGVSISGSKGHLTRRINSVFNVADQIKAATTKSSQKKNLEAAIEALDAQWIRYEEFILKAVDVNKASGPEWEKIVDESYKNYEVAKNLGQEMLDVVYSAGIAKQPQQVAAGGAAVVEDVAKAHPNIKIIDKLLPDFELNRKTTPLRMQKWKRAMESFYFASNLNVLDIETQRSFVWRCMSDEFMAKIQPKLEDTTPLCNDPANPNQESLLSVIETEFLQLYPLESRRMELFGVAQKSSQNPTELYTHVETLSIIASLHEMATPDIELFIVLNALSDKTLLKDVLELPDDKKNAKGVKAFFGRHEAALVTLKAKGGSSTSNKTSNINKGKPGNAKPPAKPNNQTTNQQQNQGPKNANQNQGKQKCTRCGSKFHHISKCRIPGHLSCHKCGKKGHFSPACPNESQNSSKQTSQENSKKEAVSSASMYYHTTSRTKSTDPLPRAWITVTQDSICESFDCLVDTGTSRSLISADVVKNFGFKVSNAPTENDRLSNASGDKMDIYGKINLTLNYGESCIQTELLVSRDLSNELLLSYQDCVNLQIVELKGRNDGHLYFSQNCVSIDASDSICTAKVKFFELPDSEKVKLDALIGKYPNVLVEQGKGFIKCPPMEIKLRGNPKPHRVHTTKSTPLHLETAANKKLQELIDNKKIEKVPPNEPSEWCCRAFWVPKDEGRVRLVSDLSQLNQHILRPVHVFKSIGELVKCIDPKAKFFIVLDLHDGYHQIKLTPESSALTTFLLPSGRYRYLVSPMGLSQSSDFFCQITDNALNGINGCLKLVDDILVMGHSYEDLFEKFEKVLQRCKEHNIALSKLKIQVGNEVHFGGYLVSDKGIKPSPERTKAIKDFKTPTDLTSLRSFLGLANQLCSFSSDLAKITQPLRELLKKNTPFLWLESQVTAFAETKNLLTSDLILKHFDPKFQTVLCTDGSRSGIGFYLYQIDPKNSDQKQLIMCGSRGLNGAEVRYSVSELELLAVLWGCRKSKHYVLGAPCFQIHTDHRSLVGLFQKDITDIENTRLRRFRENLQPYIFQIEYVPGKKMDIADALSRYPVNLPEDTEMETKCEEEQICTQFVACFNTFRKSCNLTSVNEDNQILCLLRAASFDKKYQQVLDAVKMGANLKSLNPQHPAHLYKDVFNELSIFEHEKGQLLTVSNVRIVVPFDSRDWILSLLHMGHPGYTKSKLTAKSYFYWPQMNMQLKNLIDSCEQCMQLLPSLPREPDLKTFGKYPMDELSFDFFNYDSCNYLSVVDRYSGFLWCFKVPNMLSKTVIKELKGLFLHFGFPNKLRCDNQTSFQSEEFIDFIKEHGIILVTSSPYNPESNGHAENGVKTNKHLLMKCKGHYSKFLQELAAYLRVKSPFYGGKSPFELFFNRTSKAHFPMLPATLQNENSHFEPSTKSAVLMKKEGNKENSKHGRNLSIFEIDTPVLVQNPHSHRWDAKGYVKSLRNNGRSYEILMENGAVLTRNRRFLRENYGKIAYSSNPDLCTPFSQDHSLPETKESLLHKPPIDLAPKLRRSARLSRQNHSAEN